MVGMQGIVGNNPCPAVEGGQARDEVLGLEEAAPGILPPAAFVHPCTADVGGAITERPFELEHHQPVAVDAQALLGDRRSGHVAAYALELGALVGLAGHRAVEREAVSGDGKRLLQLGRVVAGGGVLQAHGGTPSLGTHGNHVAHRGA